MKLAENITFELGENKKSERQSPLTFSCNEVHFI